MKYSFFLVSLVLSSTSFAGQLDGLTFCRSVSTGGMFGQPVGTRAHCVSFKNDVARDNANTFFGSPPEVFSYRLDGAKIINTDKRKETGYEISGNDIVIVETGAVLTRQ